MSYTTQQSAGNQPAVEYDDSLKAERQEVVVRAPAGATSHSVQLAAGTASIGGVKDNGPHWTPVRANISSADLTSVTDLTAAPTSGQKIVVDDLVVAAAVAMRVDFIEETSGTVVLSIYVPANGTSQVTFRDLLKLDTANKKLRAQASAAGAIRICCLYHSEA